MSEPTAKFPGSFKQNAAVLAVVVICALLVLATSGGKLFGNRDSSVVILYCAQDQTYAEPLLKQFEQETGLKVKAVYDSEAVKTVGLANRLLAERSHPQCDVFWGNEELRTRQLAAQNVFRETNGWAAFGHRSRRMVVNTNLVSLERRALLGMQDDVSATDRAMLGAPTSLLDLTNAIWHGKVVLAYPQFGTTAAHFHALRQLWGEAQWLAWCRALVANEAKLVDGNSVVVKLVGRGEAALGLTDSDDILAGQREGLPMLALAVGQAYQPAGAGGLPAASSSDIDTGRERNTGLVSPVNRQAGKPALHAEVLLIPNTVAVIRKAPHPQSAEKLFQFLQRHDVVEKLVAVGALESVIAATNTTYWPALLRDLDATTKQLNEVFLK